MAMIQKLNIYLTVDMTHITITSFNVRGVNNLIKRKDVFEYLKRMDSNIYCLQDIAVNKMKLCLKEIGMGI